MQESFLKTNSNIDTSILPDEILQKVEFLPLVSQIEIQQKLTQIIEKKLEKNLLFSQNVLQAVFETEVDLTNASILEITELIDEATATLTPREEKVIKNRFGYNLDGKKHTQESIAGYFDLSQQSISRIEAKLLKKLRHPSRSRRLKAFLEGKQ